MFLFHTYMLSCFFKIGLSGADKVHAQSIQSFAYVYTKCIWKMVDQKIKLGFREVVIDKLLLLF